jgi:hypothetical protein
MTSIHIHRVKCDGCEKEVSVEHASGWYHVEQVITSQEEIAFILQRVERTGYSGVHTGEFCSLTCLSSWATNANTLRDMEDKPTFEEEVDE